MANWVTARIFFAIVLMVSLVPSALAGLAQLGDFVVSRFDFGIPAWAPQPLEPAGNPTTKAKVELGRYLFYDKRLSLNGTMSCSTCHLQALAFTDGKKTSAGIAGQLTPRNSMSLVNIAYFPVLTWSNPLLHSLEQQALVPLTNEAPKELGLAGHDAEMVARLRLEPVYQRLFPTAFPEAKGEISMATVTRALGSFGRSIVSFRSAYDRYRYAGDFSGMSDSALRGESLFFGERLECHHCHNGLNFTDAERHARNPMGAYAFHNTGLYNLDGKGAYPLDNRGILEITGRPDDMGRFRTPSLRNLAVTAPYFHDGSAASVDEVIDHYAAGGRTIFSGANAGTGRSNPYKSSFVPGFVLSDQERQDLKAFLNTLLDKDVLTDPRFADPWPAKKGELK